MADQPDHIPEGYISVQDAFEDHHTKKFGFAPNFNLEGVVTDEFEAVQNELLTAFNSCHLQVLYRQPKRTENATLPAR